MLTRGHTHTQDDKVPLIIDDSSSTSDNNKNDKRVDRKLNYNDDWQQAWMWNNRRECPALCPCCNLASVSIYDTFLKNSSRHLVPFTDKHRWVQNKVESKARNEISHWCNLCGENVHCNTHVLTRLHAHTFTVCVYSLLATFILVLTMSWETVQRLRPRAHVLFLSVLFSTSRFATHPQHHAFGQDLSQRNATGNVDVVHLVPMAATCWLHTSSSPPKLFFALSDHLDLGCGGQWGTVHALAPPDTKTSDVTV